MAYVWRDFLGLFSTTNERFWTFFLCVAKLPMRATLALRPMLRPRCWGDCTLWLCGWLGLLRLRGDACWSDAAVVCLVCSAEWRDAAAAFPRVRHDHAGPFRGFGTTTACQWLSTARVKLASVL